MAMLELQLGGPDKGVPLANCVLQGGQGGCGASRAASPSLVPFQPILPRALPRELKRASWLVGSELMKQEEEKNRNRCLCIEIGH